MALDQAGDFFNETYGGNMVYLSGLIPENRVAPRLGLSPAETRENGLDIHGGMDETSQILFLRPDLVQPGYKNAQPQSGATWRELIDKGAAANWPGYYGSPRLASAARGGEILRTRVQELSDLALRILDGFDYRRLQRTSVQQFNDAAIRDYNSAANAHAREMQARQDSWLQRKGLK